MQQLGQRVHRNAGSENRHHRERQRIEAAHALVKAHLEIFRHRARLGAVIKRHHEHGQKHHRRNGADPIKMRGGNAVFRAAGRHADQFQRAEVGGHERQAGHPRRNRTPRQEEIRRRFHVASQREADADDKHRVGKQDGVINPGQMNWLHINKLKASVTDGRVVDAFSQRKTRRRRCQFPATRRQETTLARQVSDVMAAILRRNPGPTATPKFHIVLKSIALDRIIERGIVPDGIVLDRNIDVRRK